MKKAFILATTAAAALGLAACSDNAQQESAEAANAIAADTEATMGEAADDLEAATDSALGSAEAGIDQAGQSIENGADATGRAIGNTTAAAGRELEEAGNDMAR